MEQMLHRQSAGHPLGCDCCRLHTHSLPGFDIVWPLYCCWASLDRGMEWFTDMREGETGGAGATQMLESVL